MFKKRKGRHYFEKPGEEDASGPNLVVPGRRRRDADSMNGIIRRTALHRPPIHGVYELDLS